MDPLSSKYAYYTPYQFAGNTPMQAIDIDGLEEHFYYLELDKQGKTQIPVHTAKEFEQHSLLWGVIHWDTKIPERYEARFNGQTYKIGFTASDGGAGNEGKQKLFSSLVKSKNFDARIIPSLFYSEDESSKNALTHTLDNLKEAVFRAFTSGITTGMVIKDGEDARFVGSKGTQLNSKSIWNSKNSSARIDVENPNPGQRAGSLHYQDENNVKFQYNVNDKKFYGESKTETGVFDVAAPKVDKLMNNKDFNKAVDKGLRFLGEK